jgi:imidazole glycerol-phosphate synthase subunit HisF
MLFNRVIPCLLINNQGLVKTIKFKNERYIGDPINAVKLFNDKEVDEIILLDIGVTSKNQEPNYALIEEIASECFIPLCYGGGVKSISQMHKIYALGVEKISLSSKAINDMNFIKEAVNIFGSQSVVVTLDYKKTFFGKKTIYICNGKTKTKFTLEEYVNILNEVGVGEIVLNSIDNDGTMLGYDKELIKTVSKRTKIPIVALGGAGNLNDMIEIIKEANITAAAAGSLFVYHGKLKGILINYPKFDDIQSMMNSEVK